MLSPSACSLCIIEEAMTVAQQQLSPLADPLLASSAYYGSEESLLLELRILKTVTSKCL